MTAATTHVNEPCDDSREAWPIPSLEFPAISAAALYPAEVDPHLKSPYTVQ